MKQSYNQVNFGHEWSFSQQGNITSKKCVYHKMFILLSPSLNLEFHKKWLSKLFSTVQHIILGSIFPDILPLNVTKLCSNVMIMFTESKLVIYKVVVRIM